MGKQSWKPGNMIYPLPAVMVSAGNAEGQTNILTIAWTGTICTNPAMLYISVRPERYSYSMIKESGEEEHVNADMDVKSMFLLAVATSIDALAVGVTFAFLKVAIVPAVSFIGIVTFVCPSAGVKIGSLFGMKYKSKAELCGGIILILIGVKILLEGLGII